MSAGQIEIQKTAKPLQLGIGGWIFLRSTHGDLADSMAGPGLGQQKETIDAKWRGWVIMIVEGLTGLASALPLLQDCSKIGQSHS